MAKRNVDHNEILLKYIVGSVLLLASLALMSSFACLVVAKQESAQAVPQILTAIGVIGLMASICVNYATNLEKDGQATVVRCAEVFLLACLCLVFGLFVKYATETMEQSAFVKESKELSKWVGKFGLLFVKGFFLVGIIFAGAGAKDLTLHLARRQRLGSAIPPVLGRLMLWQAAIIIMILAIALLNYAFRHIWK